MPARMGMYLGIRVTVDVPDERVDKSDKGG
ncbi:hypothetical protein PDRPv_50 [Mycobacterium phage PDRPv]|uniref:Uncharacterized protein n=3 Tax=Pegunavirus TaxID=1623295 RepID=A0A161BXT9_9CAUD|nr:hypothetical protein PDRPv_50 [Mycobacterium phage PDRPv]